MKPSGLTSTSRLSRIKASRRDLREVKSLSTLEICGILAQIFLAGVAIFGYFYTVRPVYQKEQLAEQVAEYDSIIKKQTPKIREIEQQLHSLEQERSALAGQLLRERSQLASEMQRERARMTAELKAIESKLVQARQERQQLESQQEFMTFKYRSPDGSPARTQEQVRLAQRDEIRRGTLNSISNACGLYSGPFGRYIFRERDQKTPSWPFTDEEILIWKTQGTNLPLRRITDCINEGAARLRARLANSAFAEDVDSVKTEVQLFADKAAASKSWIPSYKPEEVAQEFQKRMMALAAEQAESEKAVEEKYKGRDSAFGDRKALLQQYYEIEKRNLRVSLIGKTYEAEGVARKQSDELKKSLQEELNRLLSPAVAR